MESIIYPYLLLVHIVAALALFVSEGVQQIALYQLRTASTLGDFHKVLAWQMHVLPINKIAPPTLLLSGLVMSWLYWGFALPWVNLSLVVFLVVSVAVRRVDIPLAIRLGQAVAQGQLAAAIELAQGPQLLRPALLRLGATLGLVFLMTVKPGLLGSLLGFALIWGAFVALAYRNAAPTPAKA